MLVIMRKADQNGAMGSSFTVGDIRVSLLNVGMFGVRLRVVYADGSTSVSTVPYQGELRPIPGVVLRTENVKRSAYRGRTARIGIEAPKHMRIERDDIKHRLAA